MPEDMKWERAETAKIDEDAYYVVKDNGNEWRDWDLHIIRGLLITKQLRPGYVRGRPLWIAKITNPETVFPTGYDKASD